MAEAGGEASAEIGLREIYDAVMDLKHELAGAPDDIKDHEARIRSLEKKVWTVAGAAAVGGAGLSQIISGWIGTS